CGEYPRRRRPTLARARRAHAGSGLRGCRSACRRRTASPGRSLTRPRARRRYRRCRVSSLRSRLEDRPSAGYAGTLFECASSGHPGRARSVTRARRYFEPADAAHSSAKAPAARDAVRGPRRPPRKAGCRRCEPMISEKPVRSLLGLAALAVLSTLLAGCPATSPTTPASDRLGALEEQAIRAEAAGDARTAMRVYRGLADEARGPQRARYLADAARLAIELDDAALAAEWLREADKDAGAPERQAITVLLADIDVREGRAANA